MMWPIKVVFSKKTPHQVFLIPTPHQKGFIRTPHQKQQQDQDIDLQYDDYYDNTQYNTFNPNQKEQLHQLKIHFIFRILAVATLRIPSISKQLFSINELSIYIF